MGTGLRTDLLHAVAFRKKAEHLNLPLGKLVVFECKRPPICTRVEGVGKRDNHTTMFVEVCIVLACRDGRINREIETGNIWSIERERYRHTTTIPRIALQAGGCDHILWKCTSIGQMVHV